MNRPLALAALALVLTATTPLFAQSGADFRVTIETDPPSAGDVESRVPIGSSIPFVARFEWHGEPARNVAIEVDVPGRVTDVWTARNELMTCTDGSTGVVRCTVRDGIARMSGFVSVTTTLDTAGRYEATARITSDTFDPDLSNNSDSVPVNVLDAPSLTTSVQILTPRLEPAKTAHVSAWVTNRGRTASDVTLTLTFPDGGTVAAVESFDEDVTCSFDAAAVTCKTASLARHEGFTINVTFIAPERFDGGRISARAVASSREEDLDPRNDVASHDRPLIRYLFVTSTADEGAGSLRQALLDSHTFCSDHPCTLAFRIPAPVPERGVFTIRPRTALPEVRGIVKIDGATQKTFTGETNGDAPVIELNGSELAWGAGLLLGGGCEIQVYELAINDFRWLGIEGRRGPWDNQVCSFPELDWFPNTRIARNHLSRNYRGIALVESGFTTILENVISANERSGVFVDRGQYVEILKNRITDNGASGVYLDLDIGSRRNGGGGHVDENIIARNVEWGVARQKTGDIGIRKNSIFDNGYPAIDVELDFDTPDRPVDDFTSVPNKPTLFSAAYDAARNVTVVRGRVDSQSVGPSTLTIDVYASDSLSRFGHPEAEQWIAELSLSGSSSAEREFTIEIEGDFRGRFITATNTRQQLTGWARPPGVRSHGDVTPNRHFFSVSADTSEISRAIVVQ